MKSGKVDAVALESGPGKYKSVIRYKSGEIDKKGKPEWKTQTRVFNISPKWARAHREYLELQGLPTPAADAAQAATRPAGLLESLDIAKLKELVSFFVGLKAIMTGAGGSDGAAALKEVYSSQSQLQTQLLMSLINKDAGKPGNESNLMPLVIELLKRPQNDSGNMDKMLEVLKEGINLGRDTGDENDAGPMEKMFSAIMPSLAPALAGAALGPAAQISAAPRIAQSARKPAQAAALPAAGDVPALVAQLKQNPEMAAAAHAQISAAYGKETADKLARQYGIPTAQAAAKKSELRIL